MPYMNYHRYSNGIGTRYYIRIYYYRIISALILVHVISKYLLHHNLLVKSRIISN